MKTNAEAIRGLVSLGIWALVTYVLWGVWWGWAVLWVVPGFVLVQDIVGFAMLPRLITLLDVIREALILGIWAFVAYVLWGIWWVWAVLWVVPGYILVMNIVGFATLPLYALIGYASPEAKRFRRFLHDEESRFKHGDEKQTPPDSN